MKKPERKEMEQCIADKSGYPKHPAVYESIRASNAENAIYNLAIDESEKYQKYLLEEAQKIANKALDDFAEKIKKSLPSEDEIWDIFTQILCCKKTKEDCKFTHCHHWAECDLLVKAIAKRIGKKWDL